MSKTELLVFLSLAGLFFFAACVGTEANRLLCILHRGLCIGRAWSPIYPAHVAACSASRKYGARLGQPHLLLGPLPGSCPGTCWSPRAVFFGVDVLETRSFHPAFVKGQTKATRRDMTSKSGDVLEGRRRDSQKNHPCLALTTIPSCLDN